jgi:hypothetical protein
MSIVMAEVLAKLVSGIVVSDATQKPNSTVGTPNPVFDVEIRSRADRRLKF